MAVALAVADQGWAVLPLSTLPLWLAVIASLLALDLGKYLQHVLLHRVPFLWRVHRMHHSDHDYDFTTGLRFHPFEALFTLAVNVAVIVFLGVPAVAVLVHELLFVVFAFWAHGNVHYPLGFDRWMRVALVTPDMHRVHHSSVARESTSNFGGVLTCWDRLFGTYVAQPDAGHLRMTIGLVDRRDAKYLNLPWMLAEPFLPTSHGEPVSGTNPSPERGVR